ncbi:MAG: 1-aminocyclopropane-1-carboxylate deaminase [Flavobacterium sp. BFFFF1]|uniref:1-aminocyclopropane-1-carboxylate deaminase/D-cysteine desulfhydrase n=1 Tax=Flavobacterium sp. BFFFF1 TaxID=2015557 RepID=UPI000BCF4A8B|nr:pyridoxal-phosphate dependent enzyme [Flavobacterium sp. BFFFF1]OYU81631.1 MAG: 1-aminocyclopropane-1-carboxylate deaminase [Flavobacterium sp. BFFFF1]
MTIRNQQIFFETDTSVSVFLKREDEIHPFISGNKFRKLKYNLLQVDADGQDTILTFGGAFSNHIAATAFAGKEAGLKTIGIIRGEELEHTSDENPTLRFATSCGMKLHFVTRDIYRQKQEVSFLDNLKKKFGDFYLLPEGGTNALAVKGCAEMLNQADSHFDFICCAVGTGGTISGIINSALPHQKILGFPALKGDFLKDEIRIFATNENWDLIGGYHFGGYGKVDETLVSFLNGFSQKNKVLLDPIYTGKMVFGVRDMIQNGYFPEGSKILLIHTGGLQGIEGMNISLQHRKLPIINTHV